MPDILALKAVLGIDTREFNRGLDDSEKKFSMFGDMLKANLVSKGIELAVSGIAKLGKATVDMVSQSVSAYANYEQLVGGVETLFKGAADKVMQYAQDAYINAGLSANQYMETVTSFSASLIQSLGGDTQKAADMANLAIQDMADNSNKMGTEMANIQNAYAGFAKQNYTMLDNLKLGYGGTKSEMDRLIKDAMKLDKTFKVATKTTGKGKKANEELAYSYADIVQAIHIVQTEMGITGTTAKEAEKTISGSLNMVKAAWQNLLTGLGEGSDEKVDMLVEQLIYSVEKALDNLLPVIEKVLYGIATMVEGLAPVIADKLPAFMERILPPLTKATATLVAAFTKALISNMPVIIDCAKQILQAVFAAIQQEAPGLLPIILGIGGIKAVGAGVKVASGIKNLLVSLGLIEGAGTAATAAATAAGNAAATAGGQMAGAAAGAGAMTTALGAVAASATGIVAGAAIVGVAYEKTNKEITENAKEQEQIRQKEIAASLEAYRRMYHAKGPEIANAWAETTWGVTNLTNDMYRNEVYIQQKINGLYNAMPKNLWDALKQEWDKFFGPNGEGFIGLLKAAIVDPIMNVVKTVHDWGFDLVTNFGNGLKKSWEGVKDWFTGAITGAIDGVKRLLGINSPSKVFEEIGQQTMAGLDVGIQSYGWSYENEVEQVGERIASGIGKPIENTLPKISNNLSLLKKLWERLLNGINVDNGEFEVVIGAFLNNLIELGEKLQPQIFQILKGIENLIITMIPDIGDKARNIIDFIVRAVLDSALNWGRDLITNFLNGMKQAWENAKAWFTNNVLGWLRERIHFSEPDKGPLSDFHTYAPDMMHTFAQGIRDNANLVAKAAEDSFNLRPYITGGSAGHEFTVQRNGGASSIQAATMEVDRTVFARLIFKLYNEEAGRVGVNLAGVNI